ncbi:hypothetical protein B0H13DRAFT_2328102 [Mycena leptocephala]|nr:hypothetical protein B0H13DRAFT_2328102 [Mycena leptocephala]
MQQPPFATSDTEDTKVYSTTRLRSYHGYEAPPLVDDGFVWKMPNGGRYFGREVQRGEKRYEIWSLNSLQTPYYPGVRPRASKLLPGSTKDQRRADGQLGRFDPTISPQYFDARRPWLAFLPSPRVRIDEEEAAYTPVYSVWESEPDSGFRGRLDLFFLEKLAEANTKADRGVSDCARIRYVQRLLWDDCPQEPWASSVEALKSVRSFEDAVDLVRAAQRGILEKHAWMNMASTWIAHGGSLDKLKEGKIVPADDDLMGVWAHEITELDLYFFLTGAAVPCFLIHELTEGEPPGNLVAPDFTQWTAMAARLDIGWCPYNKLASAAFNGRFTSEEHVLVTVGVPSREADDRIRSSGRWQLGLDGHHAVPACRHLLEANPSEDVEMEVEPVSPISLGPTDKELEEVKDLSLSLTQEIATTAVEALSPMPHALEDPHSSAGTSTRTEIRPRAPAAPAAPAKATVATRAKPGVLDATLTYPSLESTVLTPYLKFPGLSDVFTPSDVKAWLDGANRKVPGCGWRRIYCVPRSIRVDYYVEFQSAEAALKVRGLIDVRNGEIREATFVGEAEIRDIAERMRAVLEQVENVAETAPAPAPYAGGRYLRTEPPTSALLLKKVKPEVPPSSWTGPPTSALLVKKLPRADRCSLGPVLRLALLPSQASSDAGAPVPRRDPVNGNTGTHTWTPWLRALDRLTTLRGPPVRFPRRAELGVDRGRPLVGSTLGQGHLHLDALALVPSNVEDMPAPANTGLAPVLEPLLFPAQEAPLSFPLAISAQVSAADSTGFSLEGAQEKIATLALFLFAL